MDLLQSRKISDKIITELQSIISSSKQVKQIPVKIDNKIRIADYLIEPYDGGYWIIDVKKDRCVKETWTKVAALAWVYSSINNRKEFMLTIKELDKEAEKNDMDSRFYKYTIEQTKDIVFKEATQYRLEIATAQSNAAKLRLQSIILQ